MSFLVLSLLKNTSSKKHNRHLGNERHRSIRFFGIMSNKCSGGNVFREFFKRTSRHMFYVDIAKELKTISMNTIDRYYVARVLNESEIKRNL